MKKTVRTAVALLSVLAAAGCTQATTPKAAPAPKPAASPTLPPFPAQIPGIRLATVTGAGTAKYVTTPVKAGMVTLEVACAGNSELSADVDESTGYALWKILSQPCDASGVHKMTFAAPDEAAGLTISVTAAKDVQYDVLMTE